MAAEVLEFGFVPKNVVTDLHDIGNWKSRATAIDSLHKALKNVGSKALLLPYLPELVKFLVGLVADPNFKISISAMAIVGDLAAKAGKDLEPQLRTLVPALLEKFTDSKILVRSADMKVLRKVLGVCSARLVLELLGSGLSHSSWRVREEVVNTHILAMLQLPKEAYEPQAMLKVLVDAMADSKDKVKLVALEGLAVLNAKMGGPGFQGLMKHAGALVSDPVKAQINERLTNSQLPGINADGMVEHVIELPAGPERLASDASMMSLAGTGKLPWETPSPPVSGPRPRPRTNTSGNDASPLQSYMPSVSPSSLDRTASDTSTMRPHLGDMGSQWNPAPPSYVRGGAAGAPLPSRLAPVSDPTPSSSSGVIDRPLPSPGSSKPISNWGATGNIGLGMGVGMAVTMRSASPAHRPVSPLTSAMNVPSDQNGKADDRNLERGNSTGSSQSGSNVLQPLKHMWGGSRAPTGDSTSSGQLKVSDPSEAAMGESPLSPSRGYQSLLSATRANRTASMSGVAPVVAMGALPGKAGAGNGNAGFWLQTNLEQEHPAHRPETFSPSKAESLARLKNRQLEKRAGTAQDGDSLPSPATLTPSAGQGRRQLVRQVSDNGGCDPPAPQQPASPGRRAVAPGPYTPSARPLSRNTSLSGLPDESMPSASVSAGGARPALLHALAQRLVRAPPDTPLGHPQAHSNVPSPMPGSTGRSMSQPPASAGSVASAASPWTPNSASVRNGAPTWDKSGGADKPAGGGVAELTSDDLTPMEAPDRAIKAVIAKLIESNNADRLKLDWQGQYDALTDARRLVKHHSDVVRGVLHDFVRASAPAIDQLRSSTSKNALLLYQEMFVLLGRITDRELDEVVPIMLKKAGEVSNAGRENFLVAEADRALMEMCRNCGEARVVAALLACASHKGPTVRGKVAFHLDNHLEAIGGSPTGRSALINNWPTLEKLFKASAAFLDEGSLDTRTYGKRIIWHIKAIVGNKSDFDRLAVTVSPESLYRKVVDVVEGLNGPPPPPSRGGLLASRNPSRQNAPPSPTRVGSGGAALDVKRFGHPGSSGPAGSLSQPPPPIRQSSYSAPAPLLSSGSSFAGGGGASTPDRRRLAGGAHLDNIPENMASPGGRARAAAVPLQRSSSSGRPRASSSGIDAYGFGPAAQESLIKALQQLAAKDFRERQDALRAVEGLALMLPGAPDNLIVQLTDGLVQRVSDGNAKVAMQAVELVGLLCACLKDRMSLGINTLVPALVAALSSSTDKLRLLAISATDALIEHVEPAFLIQNFSHCVGNGNLQRGKAHAVEKLVVIANALYPSKPQLVVKYAVPAAFALLNDARGEGKLAASALLMALARLMGPALLEQAAQLSPVLQQRVADAVNAVLQ